jgi:aspartate/tyrosine/aromatic aminotransferase
MNELQKIWVKTYDEYIKALRDIGITVSEYRLVDAKKHADEVLQSLIKLKSD